MNHPVYLIYSLLLMSWFGAAAYRGTPLFPTNITEAKNDPRSVRNNPGSYRPFYSGYNRYSGGK